MTRDERYFTKLFRQRNPERPILACYWDAKRHIHFRAELSKAVKADAKRSAAARKAAKTRKARAQARA